MSSWREKIFNVDKFSRKEILKFIETVGGSAVIFNSDYDRSKINNFCIELYFFIKINCHTNHINLSIHAQLLCFTSKGFSSKHFLTSYPNLLSHPSHIKQKSLMKVRNTQKLKMWNKFNDDTYAYAYRAAGGEMFIFKSIKFWLYSATCFIKSHSTSSWYFSSHFFFCFDFTSFSFLNFQKILFFSRN